MRRCFAPLVLVLVTLSGLACSKPTSQVTPDLPEGTVMFAFNRKVRGPVELTLDGTRIPIEPLSKGKTARRLVITGVSVGKHRYFLTSPRDAFGPDQGEFELTAGKGLRIFTFAQPFNAVLYGQADPLPKAEGLPGVKARLER